MNRQNPLAAGLSAGRTAGPAERQPSAHRAQNVWSGPWPGVAGALAVLALLLAFSHVVNLGVQQGELRRQQMARQAMQRWRCDAAQQRLPGSCATEPSTADEREAAFLSSSPPSTYRPNHANNPNSPKNLNGFNRLNDLDGPNRPNGQSSVLQANR